MKHLRILALALFFTGCSTAQLNTAQAIIDPIAVAFVSGYVQQYGVPSALTTAVLTPILNDAWGMVAQAQAGQPVAQGAANPATVQLVAATNPTPAQLVDAIGNLTLAKSNPKIANALLAAASSKAP